MALAAIAVSRPGTRTPSCTASSLLSFTVDGSLIIRRLPAALVSTQPMACSHRLRRPRGSGPSPAPYRCCRGWQSFFLVEAHLSSRPRCGEAFYSNSKSAVLSNGADTCTSLLWVLVIALGLLTWPSSSQLFLAKGPIPMQLVHSLALLHPFDSGTSLHKLSNKASPASHRSTQVVSRRSTSSEQPVGPRLPQPSLKSS